MLPPMPLLPNLRSSVARGVRNSRSGLCHSETIPAAPLLASDVGRSAGGAGAGSSAKSVAMKSLGGTSARPGTRRDSSAGGAPAAHALSSGCANDSRANGTPNQGSFPPDPVAVSADGTSDSALPSLAAGSSAASDASLTRAACASLFEERITRMFHGTMNFISATTSDGSHSR